LLRLQPVELSASEQRRAREPKEASVFIGRAL
jgi:hypothetical protein